MKENRPRFLVVDDMADAADSQAMLLRLWGFGAEVAYSGAAALVIARTYRPRAVLLDIGMPGMSGFRLAQLLRELPGLADVLLIAVTGYTDEACRARALELGFARYLTKPADPEQLRALLAGLVGRPRSLSGRRPTQSPRLLSTVGFDG